MTRKALLVLGMHRSGTSALAGLLARLGLSAPKTIIGPDEHNQLGYWESDVLNQFHERLLRSAGSSWDSWTRLDPRFFDSAAGIPSQRSFMVLLDEEFGASRLLVMKDPRICRFVSFWLRNLRGAGIEPTAILTIRAPIHVALSIGARNQLSLEHSLLIWLRHVLDAERETREVKRSLVRYDDLLADWVRVVERIATDVGIEWPTKPDEATSEITAFLRPELRHHAGAAEIIGLDPPLSDWVRNDLLGVSTYWSTGTTSARSKRSRRSTT